MNIYHLNHLSSCAIDFNKSAFFSLTAQQKKITFIVAIALGFLAALYTAIHYYNKATALNGQHKITLRDGTIEEGVFVNGRLHGRGKRTKTGSIEEEGTFEKGRLHGQGKRIKTEIHVGDQYLTEEEGMFLNGRLHGRGKRDKEGGAIEEGMFENGRLHGNGKRTICGSTDEGEFKDGRLNGEGKSTSFTGKIEQGEFIDWKLIKGKITRTDGTVEEGEFSQVLFSTDINLSTRLQGQGKKITKDTIEDGNWKNGCLHGQGKRTYLNGQVKDEEGLFEMGQFVG